MPANSKYKADAENDKFRNIGSAGDETGVAVQAFGETSAGVVLPIKVVDDGSNRGKIVVYVE